MLFIGIVVIVCAWAVYTWRAWRVPPSQSVPKLWRKMAYRHPDAADALRIRRALRESSQSETDVHLTLVLDEVDMVVERIAQLCFVRNPDQSPDDVCRAAVALLVELDVLVSQREKRHFSALKARLNGQIKDLDHALRLRQKRIENPAKKEPNGVQSLAK